MSFRNAFGIYQALKQRLEASDKPLTCVELYDFQEIKKLAADANRVSDYLGHMYRRGLLSRVAASPDDNSMARYAYSWKNPKKEAPVQRHMQPRLIIDNGGSKVRPHITTSEDGRDITIELPTITITIKGK